MKPALRSAVVATGMIMLALPACSSGGGASGTTTTTPPTSTTVTASPACATGGSVTLDQLALNSKGRLRTANVFIPAGAKGTDPLPVVLSFHGAGEKAKDRPDFEGFPALGVQHGFISVYPQGLVGDAGPVSGVTGWDVEGTAVDEPAFVAALLDALGAKVCIDTTRVYASGYSNGGAMAMLLACRLSDRIAAVASVEGAVLTAGCESHPAPVPVIAFHGLDDIIVPYSGASGSPGFPAVVDVMAAHAVINGCAGGPKQETVAAGVERRTWNGCSAPVVLYTLDHHGHAWPGRPLPISVDDLASYIQPEFLGLGITAEQWAANMLLTNTSVDATALIWSFFDSIRS